MADKPAYSPGLEGVVAGTTSVGHPDPDRGLTYRGYDIKDLGENSTFEEVAYLLLLGRLPTRSELNDFYQQIVQARTLPPEVIEVMYKFPRGAHPMSMLRTAVSMLGMFDPERHDNSPAANLGKSIRLIGGISTIITAAYRISHGQKPILPRSDLNHAENFLYTLRSAKADPVDAKAFDTSLILYAEHGYNASTFAARVTASTLSDMYSAITSAIGTLKGPLHGGANEEAMKMLLEIGSPDAVERWVGDALKQKRKIMGFGHRVYKHGDARTPMLKEMSRLAGVRKHDMKWWEMSDRMEKLMEKEKGLYPNVDFYSASLYYYLGIPVEIYTPIFALARIAGWTAHVMEQHANNRLIRPASIYEGSTSLKYIPITQREG